MENRPDPFLLTIQKVCQKRAIACNSACQLPKLHAAIGEFSFELRSNRGVKNHRFGLYTFHEIHVCRVALHLRRVKAAFASKSVLLTTHRSFVKQTNPDRPMRA